MKIRNILSEKGSSVWSVAPKTTVKEAVDTLVQHNIGALLVIDGGNPIGIITERDILRLTASDPEGLSRLKVEDVMTRDLIICHSDDDIDTVMGVLTQARIRHIPIVDEGQISGMISIGDLVKAKLQEGAVTIKYLRDYITGNR